MSSEKITSEKQQEASRLNGSLSTGPVTAEGKASSCRNAVKHGIYTRAVVLQNESPVREEILFQTTDGRRFRPDFHKQDLIVGVRKRSSRTRIC